VKDDGHGDGQGGEEDQGCGEGDHGAILRRWVRGGWWTILLYVWPGRRGNIEYPTLNIEHRTQEKARLNAGIALSYALREDVKPCHPDKMVGFGKPTLQREEPGYLWHKRNIMLLLLPSN